MSLVVGVRWSFRGKDAGSVRIRSDTGATEDAASGRAARPGGTALHFAGSSYVTVSGGPKRRSRGE
jgi:hypothetical protein